MSKSIYHAWFSYSQKQIHQDMDNKKSIRHYNIFYKLVSEDPLINNKAVMVTEVSSKPPEVYSTNFSDAKYLGIVDGDSCFRSV